MGVTASETKKYMFSRKDLLMLLIPVMTEQVLTCLMGSVDTVMVSNVGSSAISAVSLVDSLNVLIIQALSALSAGGAIICSHYIGSDSAGNANHAARQLLISVFTLSLITTAVLMSVSSPLLSLLFGKADPEIMSDSKIYFFYTALSYPFIALYDSGAAVFRAESVTRIPLSVSVISNMTNIAGNAIECISPCTFATSSEFL